MNTTLNKTFFFSAVLALALVVFPSQVFAGFGVSPSNIMHENITPGGHFEQEITLSRSDPYEDLEIIIEPSLDEMKDWFSFKPGMSFIFPAGEQRLVVTAIVDVPADAPLKHYEGLVRIKAQSTDGADSGVSVVKGSRLDVDIVVTNDAIVQLVAKRLKMRDVNGDETLKLDMDVTNNGTTPAAPNVKLTILNLQQNELESLEANDLPLVNANETKAITAEFDTKIGAGEYFAIVQIMHDGQLLRQERLVFRVSDRQEGFAAITDEEDTQALGGGWLTLENGARAGLLLALAVMIYMIVARFRTTEEEEGKSSKAKKSAMTSHNWHIVYPAVLAFVFASILFLKPEQQAELRQSSKEAVAEQAAAPTPEAVPTEAEDSGDVQGAADVSEDADEAVPQEPEPRPLIVRYDDSRSGFLVYAEQDVASDVIYEAEEDETFNVIEENSRWYRVMLPSGTDGWLLKTSVKSAQ